MSQRRRVSDHAIHLSMALRACFIITLRLAVVWDNQRSTRAVAWSPHVGTPQPTTAFGDSANSKHSSTARPTGRLRTSYFWTPPDIARSHWVQSGGQVFSLWFLFAEKRTNERINCKEQPVDAVLEALRQEWGLSRNAMQLRQALDSCPLLVDTIVSHPSILSNLVQEVGRIPTRSRYNMVMKHPHLLAQTLNSNRIQVRLVQTLYVLLFLVCLCMKYVLSEKSVYSTALEEGGGSDRVSIQKAATLDAFITSPLVTIQHSSARFVASHSSRVDQRPHFQDFAFQTPTLGTFHR